MTETEKCCPKCGETKPVDAFSWRSTTRRNSYCKACANRHAKEKYWNNPEWQKKIREEHKQREREKRRDPVRNAPILARLREKRATNPEWRAHTLAAVNARRRNFLGRHLALTARKRAKDRGFPCTITPAWAQELWERGPHCVYCGKELRSNGSQGADSATLDRVVCDEGYTPENTVLACWRCNNLKRDATPEELEQLAANLRRVLNERP